MAQTRRHALDWSIGPAADEIARKMSRNERDRVLVNLPLPFGWRCDAPAVAPSQGIPTKLGAFPRLDRAQCVGEIDRRDIGVIPH